MKKVILTFVLLASTLLTGCASMVAQDTINAAEKIAESKCNSKRQDYKGMILFYSSTRAAWINTAICEEEFSQPMWLDGYMDMVGSGNHKAVQLFERAVFDTCGGKPYKQFTATYDTRGIKDWKIIAKCDLDKGGPVTVQKYMKEPNTQRMLVDNERWW